VEEQCKGEEKDARDYHKMIEGCVRIFPSNATARSLVRGGTRGMREREVDGGGLEGKRSSETGEHRIPAEEMVLTMVGICIRRFGSGTWRERIFHVWRSATILPLQAALSVDTEGDVTQSLSQLLPQQDLVQVGGRSVLLEGGKDWFRVSLVGRGRRLLRACQSDRSSWLWTVDGVGGRR